MLLTDPESIDQEAVGAEIARGGSAPRIQFSSRRRCTAEVLAQLNACCARFGRAVIVRFYGFDKDGFDASILAHIPEVRSLIIDLHAATDIEIVGQLENLEELGIGVTEGNYPNLLAAPLLRRLRKLYLINNRRNNVDLAPLIEFQHLTELLICAHARNIDVLGGHHGIRKLSLNQMKNTTRFPWIGAMRGLRDLTILLGSRTGIGEVAHAQLERLRIDRIRGLDAISLAPFPALTHLHIEDQLRVDRLDLAPTAATLRKATIWNCKSLAALTGLDTMQQLEFLWVGRTGLDPETILGALPSGLREVTLAGYGTRRDAALKEQVKAMGFAAAGYAG